MNKVEGILGLGPFLVAIFELEFDVGRYPRRLDGGHVGTNNLRIGEFIGKIAEWKSGSINREKLWRVRRPGVAKGKLTWPKDRCLFRYPLPSEPSSYQEGT